MKENFIKSNSQVLCTICYQKLRKSCIIQRFRSELTTLLILAFIGKALDLDIFKVNLFATIHLFTVQISCLTIVFKLDMLLCCKIMHVSSAHNRGAELDALFISLIYRVNSCEPRTENVNSRNPTVNGPEIGLSLIQKYILLSVC